MRLIRVKPIPAATIVHAAGTSEVEAQIWGVMWCFARSREIGYLLLKTVILCKTAVN
ncbi:hypothetical protein [Clostridium sp.]